MMIRLTLLSEMLNCEEKINTYLRIDEMVIFQKDHTRYSGGDRSRGAGVEARDPFGGYANIQGTKDGGLDGGVAKEQLRR